MKDTQVNIRAPLELVEKLDEIADALGVGRSEVVRRALAVYVAQASPVIDDLKKGRGGIWSYIFGPPVRFTGDTSDDQMAEAMKALYNEMRKQQKAGPKGATA